MSPGNVRQYAIDWVRGGKEGGERCGDLDRGNIVVGRVSNWESAENGSWRKAGDAICEGCAIFGNGVFDRGNSQHVVEGLDGGGAECATHPADGIILSNLEDLDD